MSTQDPTPIPIGTTSNVDPNQSTFIINQHRHNNNKQQNQKKQGNKHQQSMNKHKGKSSMPSSTYMIIGGVTIVGLVGYMYLQQK